MAARETVAVGNEIDEIDHVIIQHSAWAFSGLWKHPQMFSSMQSIKGRNNLPGDPLEKNTIRPPWWFL
jgi:hypothetical protein